MLTEIEYFQCSIHLNFFIFQLIVFLDCFADIQYIHYFLLVLHRFQSCDFTHHRFKSFCFHLCYFFHSFIIFFNENYFQNCLFDYYLDINHFIDNYLDYHTVFGINYFGLALILSFKSNHLSDFHFKYFTINFLFSKSKDYSQRYHFNLFIKYFMHQDKLNQSLFPINYCVNHADLLKSTKKSGPEYHKFL